MRQTIDWILRSHLQSTSLFDAEKRAVVLRVRSKPIRTVLGWQLIATAVLALLAGVLGGTESAISALLGGAVSVVAGLGFAAVIQRSRDRSAGGTLITALQAEAVKIGLALILLWVVLTTYKDVVAPVCVGSFVVSILIFSMAFFVRDHGNR